MILNYQFHQNDQKNAKTLVFIHGLFGSLSNLGMLAREYYASHHVLQIDIRNHGLSKHANDMNYTIMANDVIETLDHLHIQEFSLIGHSMGGKIAMAVTACAAERLQHLVVLDMTPITYTENQHENVFKALFAVQNAGVETRQEAMALMHEYLSEEMVIQFLIKSWNKGKWLFNVEALYTNYHSILAWENIVTWHSPVLFIRGEHSPYVQSSTHLNAIYTQFPRAQIETISGAGHWLHAEKPTEVLHKINQYLNT